MEETKSNTAVPGQALNYLKYCIPFLYFYDTRLKGWQTIFFHAWYEWGAGIFMLCYLNGFSPVEALLSYCLGYIPFIALYETGYIVNDYYASRNEDKPRLRLGAYGEVQEWEVLSWIGIRVIVAMVAAYWFDVASLLWFCFVFILLLIFGLHNFIREKEVKFLTFTGLALLRFILPLIPFLYIQQLGLVFPVVMINYVLYRMINYLASKDMLDMPNRKQPWFKLSFYLLLIPVNLIVLLIYEDSLGLCINVLYLVFWGLYFMKDRFLVQQ